MAHDVFISYSSKDKPAADAVCAALEHVRIRCWIAPRDIAPSADWPTSIVEAIPNSRVFLLIFTGNANTSRHVQRELQHACDLGLAIVPFRLENVPPTGGMKFFLGTVHWLDALTPPMERHHALLVSAIQALLPVVAEPSAKVIPDAVVGAPEPSAVLVETEGGREKQGWPRWIKWGAAGGLALVLACLWAGHRNRAAPSVSTSSLTVRPRSTVESATLRPSSTRTPTPSVPSAQRDYAGVVNSSASPVPRPTPKATPTSTPSTVATASANVTPFFGPETAFVPMVTPMHVAIPTPSPIPMLTPSLRLLHAKAWIAEAQHEAKTNLDDKAKTYTLCKLAAVQAKAGDTEGSRQTFAAALQTAQHIDIALADVAVAQAEAGDAAAALQTSRTIKDSEWRTIAISKVDHRLAAAQAKAGNIAAALKTAADIEGDESKPDALCDIAVAQAKAGDVAGSRKTFAEALQTIHHIDSDSKTYVLCKVAVAQAKAGDPVAALKTAQDIRDDWKPHVLCGIAVAQAKAGDMEGSRQTFAAAQELVRSRKLEDPNSYDLIEIAVAQVEASDTMGAVKTVQNIPGDNHKSPALRAIASAQAEAGDTAGAIQTAQSIRFATDRAAALSDIAIAQAKADVAGSRQTFTAALQMAQINKGRGRDEALRIIAAAQGRAGDFDAASATLTSLAAGESRCRGYTDAADALLEGPSKRSDN